MSGKQKAACTRGHINPPRNKYGACIPCGRLYRAENYQRDREGYIRRAAERAKANPEARRDQQRAVRLNVSVAAIRHVIARCEGKCEACGKLLSHAQMCIDHDHETKCVRGVLCRFCNALEGMLNKKTNRVAQVQAYVARYRIYE